MKKTVFLFLLLLLFCSRIFASASEEAPFSKKMKIGESLVLTGSFVLWNGFPPDYYAAPLMCFTVSDLKIEAACMEIGGIKIDIGSLKFDKKLRRLKCRLEVSNLGKQPLGYSNMFLCLRYDGKNFRAYKDSPASNMIDFSKVEIPSNGKLKEAVYFNFDDDVQMDFARLEFFYE